MATAPAPAVVGPRTPGTTPVAVAGGSSGPAAPPPLVRPQAVEALPAVRGRALLGRDHTASRARVDPRGPASRVRVADPDPAPDRSLQPPRTSLRRTLS